METQTQQYKDLKPHAEQIFAIAVGSAITRSNDPNAAITQSNSKLLD